MPATQSFIYEGEDPKTLAQLAEEKGIVFSDSFSEEDLFNYASNVNSIANAYTGEDSGKLADKDYIVQGTTITYPSNSVFNRSYYASDGYGKVYKGKDFNGFYAKGMEDLIRDDRWLPLDFTTEDGQEGSYTKVRNEYNVLLWSRVLGGEQDEGVLLNITPFVSSVNAEDSINGGTFTLNVSSPAYTYTEEDGYSLDNDKILTYQDGDRYSFLSKESYRNPEHAVNSDFPIPFFHLIASENDVVFIQFEPLENEFNSPNSIRNLLKPDDSLGVMNSLIVNPSNLVGAQWDMIGLLDATSSIVNPSDSTIVTNFAGRDLSKLIIEDGNHFFAADTGLAGKGFAQSRNTLSGINANRTLSGQALFLEAFVNRSIAFSIGFVFNQMTNIKVFDGDGPFSGYPDDIEEEGVIKRITTAYVDSLTEEELMSQFDITRDQLADPDVRSTINRKSKEEELAGGIWRAVRLVVDPELSGREIIDSSISTSQGSIQSYLDKICQMPFAQFYGQTWGDKYYFMARKPPFTYEAIKSLIDRGLILDVSPKNLLEYEFQFAENEARTWYYLEHKYGNMEQAASDSIMLLPSGFLYKQARRYGVKVQSIVSNYVNFDFNTGTLGAFQLQAAEDLEFLVESSACLPYTRRGTFIMSGDRRIKAGMWIRLGWTGEIAYVKSTSNVANDRNGESNRATVVNVERVMVEKHLDKYFNLMKLLPEASERTEETIDFRFLEDNPEADAKINFLEKRLQFVR